MIRNRSRRRRRQQDPADLDITAFLNLMVVLVPFLLITAVFTRMAVLELNVPSSPTENNQSTEQQDKLQLEVVVRDHKLIVGDSQRVISVIKNSDSGNYDYAKLSTVMQRLKQNNPKVRRVRILLEPDTQYDVLVHVMDAVRMAQQPSANNASQSVNVTLFPEIALGSAPTNNDQATGASG